MGFKVGVTFAGTHRLRVESIVNSLLGYGFSKDDIFYDDWHSVRINGIDADIELKDIYTCQCDLVVVFLSKDYNTRQWTRGVEWRAIRRIINEIQGNKICLLNIDGVDINNIDGLSSSTDIAEEIESLPDNSVAEFIWKRYELISNRNTDYDKAIILANSKRIKDSIKGLQDASNSGYLRAILMLFMIYNEGLGGMKCDPSKAQFYLNQAKSLSGEDPANWAKYGYKLYDPNHPSLEPAAFLTAAMECGHSIPGYTCVGAVRIFYKLDYLDLTMRYAEYGANQLQDEKCKKIFKLLVSKKLEDMK